MKLKYGKRTGLRYFDIENVRSWKPCYDPITHIEINKRYTLIDILQSPGISHADKIWVAMRTDLISEKCMRLFAVWSSRQVLKPDADKRLFDALEAAEKHSRGEITAEELSAARSAEQEKQIKKLIEMVKTEDLQRVSK